MRRRRQPHQHHRAALAQGRAQALERADRARSEPAAGERDSGRDHHDPRLGRQLADEPDHGRRRQPAVARDPRRRPADRRRTLAQAAKNVMDKVPEVRNARVGRDEGRPELAIQVDRPKAALLGLSVTNVAESISTSVGGTPGRVLPRVRQRVPDHRPAARGGPAAGQRRQRRPDQQPDRPGPPGEEPAGAARRSRGRPRSSARTRNGSSG